MFAIFVIQCTAYKSLIIILLLYHSFIQLYYDIYILKTYYFVVNKLRDK